MIGYNVSQIEELARKLNENYHNIGQVMAEGWPELRNVFEKEWVGPDELDYETELASSICDLYNKCTDVVQGMLDNIKLLGDRWIEFQKGNLLQNALNAVTAAFQKTIEIPAIQKYDIEQVVKPNSIDFSNSTNLGLTNGEQSGNIILERFDAYTTDVGTKVKALYSDIDTSQGFLGNELSSNIKTYLQTLGDALASLTTCHDSIKEALIELTARYKQHESDDAQSVNQANIEAQESISNIK